MIVVLPIRRRPGDYFCGVWNSQERSTSMCFVRGICVPSFYQNVLGVLFFKVFACCIYSHGLYLAISLPVVADTIGAVCVLVEEISYPLF